MKVSLVLLLAIGIFAQNNKKAIRPDGITKTVESHRVILTECDEVTIKGNVKNMEIYNGEFTIYWFKKYGNIVGPDIVCDINK